MNIQPMVTKTYNLKNRTSNVNTYMPLEHIPLEFYEVFIKWVEDNPNNLKDLLVSISTDDGYIVVPTGKGSNVPLNGLGIVEIELRGALLDFDDELLTEIYLNSKFEVVLHTTNGEYAFPIKITDKVSTTTLRKLFKTEVVNKMKKVFNKVTVQDQSVSVCCDELSKPMMGLRV